MTINKIRNIFYTVAKILGDINAVTKGKIGQRIVRRTSGKVIGRFLNKIYNILFKK
jgi:hypothetical protein